MKARANKVFIRKICVDSEKNSAYLNLLRQIFWQKSFISFVSEAFYFNDLRATKLDRIQQITQVTCRFDRYSVTQAHENPDFHVDMHELSTLLDEIITIFSPGEGNKKFVAGALHQLALYNIFSLRLSATALRQLQQCKRLLSLLLIRPHSRSLNFYYSIYEEYYAYSKAHEKPFSHRRFKDDMSNIEQHINKHSAAPAAALLKMRLNLAFMNRCETRHLNAAFARSRLTQVANTLLKLDVKNTMVAKELALLYMALSDREPFTSLTNKKHYLLMAVEHMNFDKMDLMQVHWHLAFAKCVALDGSDDPFIYIENVRIIVDTYFKSTRSIYDLFFLRGLASTHVLKTQFQAGMKIYHDLLALYEKSNLGKPALIAEMNCVIATWLKSHQSLERYSSEKYQWVSQLQTTFTEFLDSINKTKISKLLRDYDNYLDYEQRMLSPAHSPSRVSNSGLFRQPLLEEKPASMDSPPVEVEAVVERHLCCQVM